MTQRLADIHPIWREALACHESLRRLGFEAADIFLFRRDDDGRVAFLVRSISYGLCVDLRAGDAREFAQRPLDELFAEWEGIAHLWNSATVSEMDEVFAPSLIRERSALLVGDLVIRGFAIPAACDA
jgi:hypothetical protein